MKKLLPFRWYGGKYSHLDWLLPLLPQTKCYCEPFGGSAAVLLNRRPSPIETYNDLDGEVVNFFKVLRDEKNELLRRIALTPFSREEFIRAIDQRGNRNLSDIERARLFFVRAGQVRTGLAQEATPGRWAYCVTTSRRNMSGAISRWYGRLEQLDKVADRLTSRRLEQVKNAGEQLEEIANRLDIVIERLRRVQIENKPAIDVIQRYDSEGTLFYCDPPYPHESRGDSRAYSYEMSEQEHRELAEVLHNVKGKVAISSYYCKLMEELYTGWERIDAEERLCHSVKEKRQEILWINYSKDNLECQYELIRKKH